MVSQQDRVMRFVDKSDSCWQWKGYINPKGYGEVRFDGRPQHAHRAVYMLLVGPIADGLHVDHLCRVRSCVNPEHLEPVTMHENIRRGLHKSDYITHCPRGHEYTEENTYVFRGEYSRRDCRKCRVIRTRECRRRNGYVNGRRPAQ